MRHLILTILLAALLLLAACGQPDAARQAANSSLAQPSNTAVAYPAPAGGAYPVSLGEPQAAPVAVSYAAPTLGVVIDTNMRVLAVDRWSAAERAGIQPGDRLEAIDGVAFIGNTAQVKEHVRAAAPDQKSVLTITRNGQKMQLELVLRPTRPIERPTATDDRPPPTATPVAPGDDYL